MASINKRRRSDGTLAYQVTIRRKGLRSAISRTFNRLGDARDWAKQTETDLQRGALTTGSLIHTVSEALDRYEREEMPRLRSAYDRGRHLAWWRKRIGALRLADLNDSRVQECLRELRDAGKAPATINRYRAALSAALEFTRLDLKWLRDNPVGLTKKLKEPRGRTRFLSDEERGRLLEACEAYPDLHLMALIALTTGARQGEVLSIRWSNIDLPQRAALIPDTKNDEPRVLPLSESVVAALQARVRRVGPYDWLFSNPLHPTRHARFPKYDWDRARDAAELSDFVFHDLRHTAASYLAQNGASTRQLADMLGHKTLAMVQRYSHLTVESRRPLVDFLDSKISR